MINAYTNCYAINNQDIIFIGTTLYYFKYLSETSPLLTLQLGHKPFVVLYIITIIMSIIKCKNIILWFMHIDLNTLQIL